MSCIFLSCIFRAAGKMTIEGYIGLAIGMTMSCIFLSCIFRAAGKMTIEGYIGLAIGMTISCIFLSCIFQGRQRRCGWCGHGRTTFSGTLRNSFCQLNLFSNSGCIVGFSASLEVPLQPVMQRAARSRATPTRLHCTCAKRVQAMRMYTRARMSRVLIKFLREKLPIPTVGDAPQQSFSFKFPT